MADLEYRANIIVRVIGEFFWYAMQLTVFEVLYLHADQISGWTIHDMRVFMGALFVGDVLYMIFLQENMDYLWSIIRKGDLDMYLVKPINSQFMVSCRKISVSYFINLVLVSIYAGWAISRLEREVSVWQILSFLVLILLG
jgi:ABC-2 type transport system permease protein